MGASCLDADGVATPERGPLVLLAHARLGTSAKSRHQDGRHLLGVSKAPVPAPVVTGLGRSLRGDRRVVLIRPQPVVDLLSSRTGRRTRRTRVQPGVTIPALVASTPLGHHADVLSRAQPSKSTQRRCGGLLHSSRITTSCAEPGPVRPRTTRKSDRHADHRSENRHPQPHSRGAQWRPPSCWTSLTLDSPDPLCPEVATLEG